MQDNNLPNESNTTTPPTPAKSSNKKLLLIAGAALGVLLLTLIVLIAILISKSGSSEKSSVTEQSAIAEEGTEAKSSKGREVLLRAPTSDPKLEYVIYKPAQNGANTTIYFAVENICSGCSDKTYAGTVTNGFDRESSSFLVDDTNGKKYSLITDEDGQELASPTCATNLAYGEKMECFASFTKTPSGSTVSWVFGNTRIENIKVE